jgi:hypothetical protein
MKTKNIKRTCLIGLFLLVVFVSWTWAGKELKNGHGARVSKMPVFVARTVDGLPVEAEFVRLFRDELRVRLTSSGREIVVALSGQKEGVQKAILALAEESRKGVVAMAFKVAILENTSLKEAQRFPQKGKLHLRNFEPIRLLFPGARCLRIKVVEHSVVDIPVEAHIYWYARGGDKGMWSMEFYERAELAMGGNAEDEYLSQSPRFPRPAYQGYALLIFNKVNKALLWKGTSGAAFLQDALRRQGLTKVPVSTTKASLFNGKQEKEKR